MTGRIRHLNVRGFGFIEAEDGGDLFFAARFVDRTCLPFAQLRVGDKVQFHVEAGVRGLEAHAVRFLSLPGADADEAA
jgi:cold shock CspA family protein